MQVNGIIAEYNPFHNGHKYHIDTARKQTGADYTVIVMSGSFTQRGIPAILDKYTRAEMALQSGADLVLELPSYYAAASAEYFASGAVALLDQLGIVTHLCFGSECGDITVMKHLAGLLLKEPPTYAESLRSYLRQGISYPTARAKALMDYEPSVCNHGDILSSPNNILGIEYLKALQQRSSSIIPCTTLRAGADYHDIRLLGSHCSADAIRHAIREGCDTAGLRNSMPENAYQIMLRALNEIRPVFPNDFSSVLLYKLLSEQEQGYEQYLDVSSDLSDRIRKHLQDYVNYESFCNILKRKETTYTRISRCLLHILLNMKETTMQHYREMDYTPYARVLGFRKESIPLLTAIKENTSIPLITKLADADKLLNDKAYAMLKEELQINQVYQCVVATRNAYPMKNELSTPVVII